MISHSLRRRFPPVISDVTPGVLPLIKDQLTVRKIGTVCWIAPDEAVTVTVEVTSGGDEPLPLLPVPLPQPKVKPNPMSPKTASINNGVPRRLRQPNRNRVAATAVIGNNGPESEREAADCASAEMVSWAVAAPPEGVTVAGLKEHVAPAGRPEQAKLTGESNPFCGVTVRLTVPSLPETTVSEGGDVSSVNVGVAAGGRLIA